MGVSYNFDKGALNYLKFKGKFSELNYRFAPQKNLDEGNLQFIDRKELYI